MGEAKRRRASGVGSRTEARKEAEKARRKAEAEAWWAELSPEEKEVEMEKERKRRRGRKSLLTVLAAACSIGSVRPPER